MPRAITTYSAHALRRMEQRAISEAVVITTLNYPTRAYLGSQGNMIAEKRFGDGRTARVVYESRLGTLGESVHIISVMWK